MLNRSDIEDHLPPVEPDTLIGHYTKLATLPMLFKAAGTSWSSAWATPVQFLNDRREILFGLSVLLETCDQLIAAALDQGTHYGSIRQTNASLQEGVRRPDDDAFQLSFSQDMDELGQWRAYAADGFGCCVVVKASVARDLAQFAGPVLYREEEQRQFARAILEKLGKHNPAYDSPGATYDVSGLTYGGTQTRLLVAAACFMKHSGFAPEREYRLIWFRDRQQVEFRDVGSRIVPYIDVLADTSGIHVEKIVVGPSWQLIDVTDQEKLQSHHVIQGIQRLNDFRGTQATVDVSKIPYDPR